MKFLVFHLYLKPLILENLRLRAAGLLPDEWYWADRLAVEWGYLLDSSGEVYVMKKKPRK